MANTGPSKDQEDRTAQEASLWEGRGGQARRAKALEWGLRAGIPWQQVSPLGAGGLVHPRGSGVFQECYQDISSQNLRPRRQRGALCSLAHEGHDQGMQSPPGALPSCEEAMSPCGPVDWNQPSPGSCPSPDPVQEESLLGVATPCTQDAGDRQQALRSCGHC